MQCCKPLPRATSQTSHNPASLEPSPSSANDPAAKADLSGTTKSPSDDATHAERSPKPVTKSFDKPTMNVTAKPFKSSPASNVTAKPFNSSPASNLTAKPFKSSPTISGQDSVASKVASPSAKPSSVGKLKVWRWLTPSSLWRHSRFVIKIMTSEPVHHRHSIFVKTPVIRSESRLNVARCSVTPKVGRCTLLLHGANPRTVNLA